MPNLFSVPIFFLVFRETLEAAIVISVLLGLAEQIVLETATAPTTATPHSEHGHDSSGEKYSEKQEDHELPSQASSDPAEQKAFIRKLRIQVCSDYRIHILEFCV